MLISHELPLSLLKVFNKNNDYDFILPRFWKKYSSYREHYSSSTRFKILDNGLFEGDNYSDKELVDLINEIQPDIFVVPDAWNNANYTSVKAKSWMNNYKKLLPAKTNLMPVLQGSYFDEIRLLLLHLIDLGYKHFAFNHSSDAYQELFKHPNKQLNAMMGRIYIISLLKQQKILEENHYIHLLGASLPQEFMYYKDLNINSVDTANPVINGALGTEYTMGGLLEKSPKKLEDFMEMDLLSKMGLISWNINKFREMCSYGK